MKARQILEHIPHSQCMLQMLNSKEQAIVIHLFSGDVYKAIGPIFCAVNGLNGVFHLLSQEENPDMRIVLKRAVTQKECDWLPRDLLKGESMYLYPDHTYGCISLDGTACTFEYGIAPFYEIPNNAFDYFTSIKTVGRFL